MTTAACQHHLAATRLPVLHSGHHQSIQRQQQQAHLLLCITNVLRLAPLASQVSMTCIRGWANWSGCTSRWLDSQTHAGTNSHPRSSFIITLSSNTRGVAASRRQAASVTLAVLVATEDARPTPVTEISSAILSSNYYRKITTELTQSRDYLHMHVLL